jgi:uncharacterized membrane protein
MKKHLDLLFNWKHNPASVFVLLVLLALIGFGATLALAVIHFLIDGTWGFLVIWFAGITVLIAALWPIRKQLMEIK